MLFLSFAVVAVVLFVAPVVAGAQEETTSARDEVLTRYDSLATEEMSAEAEANQARAEDLEARIEELENAGDFGPRRDELRDELYDMPDSTEADNALGDSRLSDIESAPLPKGREAKAAELRRKAQSLDALQAWAAMSDINIDSRLYGLIGEGEAASLASTYRKEAGALEVAEGAEEAVEEKTSGETTEAAAEETVEETTKGAAGGGAEEGLEGNPAGEADELGGSGDDTGVLAGLRSAVSGFSITSLLAAGLIALGVGYYVIGLVREGLGERAKRIGSPQQARVPKAGAKKPPPQPRQAPRESTERSGSSTAAPGESRSGGGREEPAGKAQRRVTPGSAAKENALDDEALAEWFSQEMQEPEKKESRRSERSERQRKRRGENEAPEAESPGEAAEGNLAPQRKDVNQMVADQVARLRKTGELGPEDEVEVRMEDGRIVVRKKE